MKKNSKPIILIPAFDEEKWIGRTIDLVKATGIDASIIVVNDGSTDRTAEIAMEKGCQVLTHGARQGKTAAVFTGLNQAFKMHPQCVALLEADLLAVPKEGLKKLINESINATLQRRVRMCVGKYHEALGATHFELSGIRSFSFLAVKKLLTSKYNRLPKGFGLENFLNDFFRKELFEVAGHVFVGRRALGGKAGHTQFEDLLAINAQIARLKELRENAKKMKRAGVLPKPTRRGKR